MNRNEKNVNQVPAQEVHKLATKKCKRRKACARFKVTIWAADLAEIKLLPSKYLPAKYLLCGLDIFAKYATVKKKVKTVINTYCKPGHFVCFF